MATKYYTVLDRFERRARYLKRLHQERLACKDDRQLESCRKLALRMEAESLRRQYERRNPKR